MEYQLNTQFNSLPSNLKKEVKDFIEFLSHKNKKKKKRKKRKFGILKGKIKMLPDFDKPLDDFKEYM